MYRHLQKVTALVVCLGWQGLSYAVPSLNFSGGVDFNSGTHLLNATGVIIAEQEIPSQFDSFINSTINFNSEFDMAQNFFGFTVANFTPANNSLQIVNFANEQLILADLTDISLSGLTGNNFGIYMANFWVTGGLYQHEFANQNQLFSLQFNLNQPFSPLMFNHDFSGDINGSLDFSGLKVPEPASILVMIVGAMGLGYRRYRNRDYGNDLFTGTTIIGSIS